MALTLYYHPLSSYCHKVLIALEELGIAADLRLHNPGDAAEREAYLRLWPTGKIPLLVDDGVAVPETSVMIEHLQLHHGKGATLVPADARAALEVRLWDRLMDLYVMTPLQAIIGDRLRPEADRDAFGVNAARGTLAMAYGMLERRLAGRTWLGSDRFSLADCAATPSLFYARTLVPTTDHPHLSAYFERLLERPSVRHAIEQARPFFQFYPGKEGLEARFLA